MSIVEYIGRIALGCAGGIFLGQTIGTLMISDRITEKITELRQENKDLRRELRELRYSAKEASAKSQ